jgi:hypothetical protein
MAAPQTLNTGAQGQVALEAEDMYMAALARSRKRLAGSTAGSTGPLGLRIIYQSLNNDMGVMPADRDPMRHVLYRLFQSGRIK